MIQDSNEMKRVIAILSGKGGVGTSLVTSLLAISMRRQGLHVGILDGNLTSPSIAHIFGAKSELSVAESGRVEPLVSDSGVKVISMSMFLENESAPLGWYGPMIASAIRQFYTDTEWGQLDYLLVDSSSCMSDATLAILQSFPREGTIIVSSPQALAVVGAKRCINLVHQFQGVIIGVVENMLYFEAPDGERYELYGPSCSDELVALSGAPLLAQLPFDSRLTALCDSGRLEEYLGKAGDMLTANFFKALSSRAQL